METAPEIQHSSIADSPLFVVDMKWGLQPVRLSAHRMTAIPTEAPTTSVHIVAFQGDKVLVVRDRRGVHGFPGGRLETGESPEEALVREVYEEARAHLKTDYALFSAVRVEYTTQLPQRKYPHPYTYLSMYVGQVKSLEPIGNDPAGIITARALFTKGDCEDHLQQHDRILLYEALCTIARTAPSDKRALQAFSGFRPNSTKKL